MMTPMMILDLDGITARLAAATPGPWKMHEHTEMFSRDDAEFIAHAPDDIKALLAENERLQSVIDTIRNLRELDRVDFARRQII